MVMHCLNVLLKRSCAYSTNTPLFYHKLCRYFPQSRDNVCVCSLQWTCIRQTHRARFWFLGQDIADRSSYGRSRISNLVRLGHPTSIVDYATTSARNREDDEGKCTENKVSCESSHPCRDSHWTAQVASYSEQTMPLTPVPLANEIVTICAALCNLSPALVTWRCHHTILCVCVTHDYNQIKSSFNLKWPTPWHKC